MFAWREAQADAGGVSGLVDGRHAATHVALYRRARHRSVRAKHAAIAREGLEPFAAPFAVIEELAGIGRHRLDSLMAAFRASQVRLKLHIGHPSRRTRESGVRGHPSLQRAAYADSFPELAPSPLRDVDSARRCGRIARHQDSGSYPCTQKTGYQNGVSSKPS